jgi:hypothetical protein
MSPASPAASANRPATLVGFSAIVLRSALAFLTAPSGEAPLFELASLAFAVGGEAIAGSMIGQASAAVDFGFRTWRPRYMPLLRSI